jgi:hypothetical protein
MNPHKHIASIRQLAGSTQWMALNDDGYMDVGIRVISCGDGVFILESFMARTFWHQTGDKVQHDCYLSAMDKQIQSMIVHKMNEEAIRHAR